MMKRVLTYDEVLIRLRRGEEIHWLGGAVSRAFRAYMGLDETVRMDTLSKLYRQGLITGWGFPALHGSIALKGKETTND